MLWFMWLIAQWIAMVQSLLEFTGLRLELFSGRWFAFIVKWIASWLQGLTKPLCGIGPAACLDSRTARLWSSRCYFFSPSHANTFLGRILLEGGRCGTSTVWWANRSLWSVACTWYFSFRSACSSAGAWARSWRSDFTFNLAIYIYFCFNLILVIYIFCKLI